MRFGYGIDAELWLLLLAMTCCAIIIYDKVDRRLTPKRSAQIWRGFSARFAPTLRPAFHDTRSRALGSNSDNPMTCLLRL
jgi:hypothetical protein